MMPTIWTEKNREFEPHMAHFGFSNIKEVIQSVSDSKELEEARHAAKAEAWMHEGEAGKNIVDFMISKIENK